MTNDTKDKEKKQVTKKELVPNPPAPLPAVQTGKGEGEHLDFFGIDTTSFTELTLVQGKDIKKDKAQDRLSAWEKDVVNVKADQKKEVINEGIEIARQIAADANLNINFMQKAHAERAIAIGNICNHLKRLVKDQDVPWVVWAEDNLGFLGKRNRERYMLIARRTDCYRFTFLGIDRLEMLCTATKNSTAKDPIGQLLKSHKITFNPKAESNLQEFKAKIDAALSCERLTKKGLSVDFNMIVNLIYVGVEIDNSLIKTLTNIKDCGGDPVKHLEHLALTGGKDPSDTDGSKKPEDFNKLSNRLIQTLDYLIDGVSKDTISIDQLDKESFAKLLEKLGELNRVASLTNEETSE